MMRVFLNGMTFEYFFSSSNLELAVFREGVPEIICDFSQTQFYFYRFFRNSMGPTRVGSFPEFLIFCKFWGGPYFPGEIFLRNFRFLKVDFELEFKGNLSFERVVDQDLLFYFEMIFNKIRRACPNYSISGNVVRL